MNKNGTIVNGNKNGHSLEDLAFEIGEQHTGTSYDTPLRKDAFDKTDDEKIELSAGILKRSWKLSDWI